MIKNAIDFVGRSNFLYLRNAIARERGMRPIVRGYRLRELGRPTFPNETGKRNLPGRRITGTLSTAHAPDHTRGIELRGSDGDCRSSLTILYAFFQFLTWIFGWPAARS